MSIDENGAFDDSRLLGPFELAHQILPNLMPMPAPLKKEADEQALQWFIMRN
jgi:hypothetical protein